MLYRTLFAVLLSALLPAGHAFAQTAEQVVTRAAAATAFENARDTPQHAIGQSPTTCITAWLMAGQLIIANPDAMAAMSLDLRERNASALWRHWWMVHYEANGGPGANVPLFQPEQENVRLANMYQTEPVKFFEQLGRCWVTYRERKFDEHDLFLRNYLVQARRLPPQFAVSAEERAKRRTMINVMTDPVWTGLTAPRDKLLQQCEDSGGVPVGTMTERNLGTIENTYGETIPNVMHSLGCEVF